MQGPPCSYRYICVMDEIRRREKKTGAEDSSSARRVRGEAEASRRKQQRTAASLTLRKQQSADRKRKTADRNRNYTDGNRQSAERKRQTAERNRQTADRNRQTAERSRQTAERSRQAADGSRQTARRHTGARFRTRSASADRQRAAGRNRKATRVLTKEQKQRALRRNLIIAGGVIVAVILWYCIKEINMVLWASDNEATMEEAEEAFKEAEKDDCLSELQTIVYDKKRKGFYIQQEKRKFDLNDIRLLAQCVYSARFLTQGQSDRLAKGITEFVSEHQKNQIKSDAFLADRIRTSNKSVINNISTINSAMRKGTKDAPHVQHKICFKYLKYNINDVNQQAERRQGKKYIVSPFKLLINDGNYYLLAYSDQAKDMRTFRVDRMKRVDILEEPRVGVEVFKDIDLANYTKRVFSMFGGDQKRVKMRFINPLLDTVIERFGTGSDVFYMPDGDSHFIVIADVQISDQFFSWICGFRKKATIQSPSEVVEGMKAFLQDITDRYKDC